MSAPRPPPVQRYAFRAAAVVLGVCFALGAAEASVRIAKPQPPVQMVRGNGLHVVDGVPVWTYSDDRHNRACAERHPGRTRVVFFGSSITFGSGLTRDETFTTALEAHLNRVRPASGFCILNFAQAGFSFEQKYTIARSEIARYRPALVMWEHWIEWMDYEVIGETAYGVSGFARRADGSIGIAGVPDRLNHRLLLGSRLYEFLTLRFGERFPRPPVHDEAVTFVNTRFVQVPRLAQTVGARLVVYPSPPLERPFAETAASPPEWHGVMVDYARAHGIPAYPLQDELVDQDHLALRMDPCCHFSAEGHRALVPVMARIILRELDAARVSPGLPPRE